MDGTTALAVLGLAPGASSSQIKAAFRTKAKLVHPDHLGTSDGFLALREAYVAASADAGRLGPGGEPDRGTALGGAPRAVRPADGLDVSGTTGPATPDGQVGVLPRRRPARWLVDLTTPAATVDVLDVTRPAATRPAAASGPVVTSFAHHLAEALAS